MLSDKDLDLAKKHCHVISQALSGAQLLFTPSQLSAFLAVRDAEAMDNLIEIFYDINEIPYTGYENPNTFKDGVYACIDSIRALIEPKDEQEN
jgi:hypothetical protein